MENTTVDLTRDDQNVANALQERLASGRPMPRSLRRAYAQLLVRESSAGWSPETGNNGS